MPETPDRRPFSETDLESPEYRERLRRKLTCLIALLEVALARVRRSLADSGADVDRLQRIRTNLQSTLDVCVRARAALEHRQVLPLQLSETLTRISAGEASAEEGIAELGELVPRRLGALPAGAGAELSSADEWTKFERLGRIERREIERCDLEELARRLQG